MQSASISWVNQTSPSQALAFTIASGDVLPGVGSKGM